MIELVAKSLESLLGRLSGSGEGLRKTEYRHRLVMGQEERPSLAKVEVPGRTESWVILSEGSPGRRCGALPWKVERVSQPEGSGHSPHSWHRKLLGLPGACVGTRLRSQLPVSAPVEQNGESSDMFTPTLTPAVCTLRLYQ